MTDTNPVASDTKFALSELFLSIAEGLADLVDLFSPSVSLSDLASIWCLLGSYVMQMSNRLITALTVSIPAIVEMARRKKMRASSKCRPAISVSEFYDCCRV